MAIEDILKEKTSLPNFVWIFDSFLRSKNKNNFRTWVNFKSEADLFLNFVKTKQHVKKIAIIHVITPTVVEQQNVLILPGLVKLGVTDHLVIPYQMDQLDFKSIALKVKSFKPDLIFLSGFQHNMTPLIRSFRALSLIKDDNTVATYDLLDAISLMRPEELEGIRFSMPAFLLSKDEKMEKWKERFRSRFNKDPLYTHIYAHEMATILYDVASRRKQGHLKSIVELIGTTNIDGIIGALRFNQNGDIETDITYGFYKNGILRNSGD
jgi:ABC-type branched-subunit amino acid transport system substrate-binding protein